MNLLLSSSFSLLLLCIASITTLVKAEYAVKIFFNNGIVDSTKTCTSAEWDKVQLEIQKATWSSARRQRNLPAVTASWCREECSQMKYCLIAAPKCALYTTRRALLEAKKLDRMESENLAAMAKSSSSLRRRELTWVDNTCSQDISILNTTINGVIPSVGSSCQRLLQSPRTFTCIDVDSCVIQNLDLWNADTDSLISANFPLTGGRICESTAKMSFQAVTNYCVNMVKFDVWGPNWYYRNRTEIGKPFNLFGESGSDIYGEKLQRGFYNMHVLADGNWSKVKSLQFDVVNCAAIERINLWIDGKVNVTNYPSSGGRSMCDGDSIALQAVTNTHAFQVKFNIWGPVQSERLEVGGEYFSYGDNGSGTVYGEKLPAGNYTMTAVVNDDYTTEKQVLFEVRRCAEILQIDLWNANTDTIVQAKFPATGGSICSSQRVTFRAVTNSYARKARFDMWGPVYAGLTVEGGNNFFQYGHNGYGDVYGNTLPTGGYIMKVWLNDDYSTVKEVNFNVISC